MGGTAMRIILNSIIPFPGFLAINLFGFVFTRRDAWERTSKERQAIVRTHEAIHTAQMRELWYVGFYIIYLLEWLYRLVFHTKTAYRGISFEVEAYDHEREPEYLLKREKFAQWKRSR